MKLLKYDIWLTVNGLGVPPPFLKKLPPGPLQKLLVAFVLFLFFFSVSTLCLSQSFLVHQYSESEGLPSATVYDAAQDPWGRMWFATRTGIAVYDGVAWKTYTLSDGLPVLAFNKIKIDRTGRVWALSHWGQGGLSGIN